MKLTKLFLGSMVCGILYSVALKSMTEIKKFFDQDYKEGRLLRTSVFYDLMGKSEDDFVKDAKHYGGIGNINLSKYKPRYRNRAVDAEKSPFVLETVGNLKQEFATYKKNNKPAASPGQIVILDGFKIRKKQGLMAALKETDIRYLQEKYPGSVFQLASNFNCLEGGVGTSNLSHMIYQPVQGENAVLSTLGGGFIRKYLINFQDRNLLKFTNAQVSKNGTVENKIDFTEKDIDSIAIGYHKDVVVTSGYYPPFVRTVKDTLEDLGGAKIPKDYVDAQAQSVIESNTQYFKDLNLMDRIQLLFSTRMVASNRNPVFVFNSVIRNNSILVDQVLASALNICPNRPNAGNTQSAKIILKAMYAGTVLAAAVRGKNKLFLTLVGAGAFCNEPSWIMQALDQDIIKAVIAYTGMEVILVLYPDVRSGRGLDTKPYDTKGTPSQQKEGSALSGIYEAVDALNKEITKLDASEDQQEKPDVVEKLASALQKIETKK